MEKIAEHQLNEVDVKTLESLIERIPESKYFPFVVSEVIRCYYPITHYLYKGKVVNNNGETLIEEHLWMQSGDHVVDYLIAPPSTKIKGVFIPSEHNIAYVGLPVKKADPIKDLLYL